MIFVAVGTHTAPFDRLLAAVDAAAAELGEEFVVQRGASTLPLPRCTSFATLPPDVLTRHLAEARRVVLHGGTSLFLEARSLGRAPILVPRRRHLGEHVDDHQLEFARSLGPGEALICDVSELASVLRSWDEPRVTPRGPSTTFADALGRAIGALVKERDRP